MSDGKSVVIVEDDVLIATDFRMMCEEAGAKVLDVLNDAAGAAERIRILAPTHVLLNVRLNGTDDGIGVADDLCAAWSDTRLVFVTASDEPRDVVRTYADTAHCILSKPVGGPALRDALSG